MGSWIWANPPIPGSTILPVMERFVFLMERFSVRHGADVRLTASFRKFTASFPNPTASFCELTAAFLGQIASFSGQIASFR